MATKANWGNHIKRLRKSLGRITQAELARRLNAKQATVSSWEGNDPKRAPSAEIYFRLAQLAPYSEALWFLRRAGIDSEILFSLGQKLAAERTASPLQGEIIRISRFRETVQGRETAGPPIPLPVEFTPNSRSTICLAVDEKSTGMGRSPAGVFIVDTSLEGAEDLTGLWDCVVVLRYAPAGRALPPHGVYVGRLLLGEVWQLHQPDFAAFEGRLFFLERGPTSGWINIGSYVEAEGLRGIPLGDVKGRSQRVAEIKDRALSAFRMDKGIRILGKVIGRLTGHLG